MSRDSTYNYNHMHASRHADIFEEFCKDKLPDDEIYVPPQHQPLNPEDEDDVVPDQHAAFGIQRAMGRDGNKGKGEKWKDLGLEGLMGKGPGSKDVGKGKSVGAVGGAAAGKGWGGYKGLPR